MTVLVFAEHNNKSIKLAKLDAVTAAALQITKCAHPIQRAPIGLRDGEGSYNGRIYG